MAMEEKTEEIAVPKKKKSNKGDNNGEPISAILPSIPALDQITEPIKEQIQGHYIAQIIYKDLQENLEKRDKLAQEIEAKIHNIKAQVKLLVANREKLQPQIDEMVTQEQQFQQEHQSGAQAWEEQIADIDRQMAELQARRAETEQQQLIWITEQETAMAQLQGSIEQLQKQSESILSQQEEMEEQIRLLPIPAELPSLDARIADLVYHICSIFQPAEVEHPSPELAIKETSPGVIAPPIFFLDPWTADDNQGLTQINVPIGAKQLILSLNMPGENNMDSYSAELYSSNGRRVWNNDKLPPQGPSISLTFNVTFFLSDDYEMRLRGRNSTGKNIPVAEYYFHIAKK
jgi:hypothetical protein